MSTTGLDANGGGKRLTLPVMPGLWDKAVIYVSHKALAGALANWAVRQSPYTVPENLGAAIKEFMSHWKGEDFQSMDSGELYTAIGQTIAECPLIEAWNHPKIGNHEYVFVSRYDTPKPDYDFIDLGALVRNVAHDLTLWAQVDHAQDATHDEIE